jgi:hypothetical protein
VNDGTVDFLLFSKKIDFRFPRTIDDDVAMSDGVMPFGTLALGGVPVNFLSLD